MLDGLFGRSTLLDEDLDALLAIVDRNVGLSATLADAQEGSIEAIGQ
jgi:hypothetical protein